LQDHVGDAESYGEYVNCCEDDVMWARHPPKGGIGRLRNDSAGSKSAAISFGEWHIHFDPEISE